MLNSFSAVPVENIAVAMKTKCVKNYHFGCFLNRTTSKSFSLENFHLTNEQLFACYDHLCMAIYFDSINCLHH